MHWYGCGTEPRPGMRGRLGQGKPVRPAGPGPGGTLEATPETVDFLRAKRGHGQVFKPGSDI